MQTRQTMGVMRWRLAPVTVKTQECLCEHDRKLREVWKDGNGLTLTERECRHIYDNWNVQHLQQRLGATGMCALRFDVLQTPFDTHHLDDEKDCAHQPDGLVEPPAQIL
ncbi:hypothetical protein C0J52_26394 [Blattella germanica]|nr:hypothetical protein C0J52_26394 [Blattella germanica]